MGEQGQGRVPGPIAPVSESRACKSHAGRSGMAPARVPAAAGSFGWPRMLAAEHGADAVIDAFDELDDVLARLS